MKILVTNHWLKKLGGSETFTYTLIGELVRRGHKVDVYAKIAGDIAIKIYKDFKVKARETKGLLDYDLVFANHKTCVHDIREIYNGTIIQTCHGITPKLEQPSGFANFHVAISEEIQNYIYKEYYLPSAVIHNGIDCTRFKPIESLSRNVKRVLSLSHSNELNLKLARYFHKKEIDFVCHNKYTNPTWNIEYLINRADMVISLGRGAYEAMACGRAVLILDHRPYQDLLGDGIITRDNFHRLILSNCSGRACKRTDLYEMLDESIEKYNLEMGKTNRQLALEFLNISKQTDKYFEIYGQIKQRN